MKNQKITNTQTSILELSPARDIHGDALVLRPMETTGCSREISGETAITDLIVGVVKAGWAKLEAVEPPAMELAPSTPVAPAATAPVAPEPEKTEESVVAAPVKTEEEPAAETAPETPPETTEAPAEPVAEPAVEPAPETSSDAEPAKTEASSKSGRNRR